MQKVDLIGKFCPILGRILYSPTIAKSNGGVQPLLTTWWYFEMPQNAPKMGFSDSQSHISQIPVEVERP